ncbi:MAG: S9 family peptidase [Woeseiaceae bacterium]|nr:S9 family peptidase [Woeseiaceae bacterium]
MSNLSRIILSAAFGLLLATAAHAAREVPVEDFFKRSGFSSFQLSPDGKYLAAITPVADRRNIAVINLDTREAKAITRVTDRDIYGFSWANNDRLLFFMDKDGNESLGIFAVNKDGSRPRTLIEPAETQIRGGSRFVRSASVINLLEDDPEHVLVSVPRIYQDTVIQDVKKMNILSGRATMVERNPGEISAWITNYVGDVVGAIATVEDETRVLWRKNPGDEWTRLIKFESTAGGFYPAWINKDASKMYVSSTVTPEGEERDKAALYHYDLLNNRIGELVFEHDNVDIGGVFGSEISDDIVAVTYVDEKPGRKWVDEKWAAIMEPIEAAFPDKIVSINSVTDDEKLMVLAAWNSRNPSTYYLFDVEKNTLEELGSAYDWLDAADLGEMKPVTITARDGLELPAYLTLPPGSDGKDLPLVVNPHGGPRARDTYGFRPDVQLMANRGYAVLQVNFRGSTGYGREFDKAGWKRWGLEMQDDITDSVKWAIEQGIADPDRVCIFGGSYGGYAAMAGITFTPDLYQCGINYVGVVSIPLLFDTMPAAWRRFEATMKKQIGDPDKDAAQLEDRSPINHVDKIRVPVLMAYGLQDPRVVIDHALKFEKELKRHEVDYELIVKKKEGHGFVRFENQVEFYTKVIDFLDEHIGESATTVASASE